jgi:hypothetical protein
MDTNIGDAVQPVTGLALNIVQIGKGPQRHEIATQIFDARFHFSFGQSRQLHPFEM